MCACVLCLGAEQNYKALSGIAVLFVILTLGLYMIKIEDGDKD